MTLSLTLTLLIAYFGLVIGIAYLTTRTQTDDNMSFFRANQNAPWWVVAFGMIGASLSGVTFISVPGWVKSTSFGYMQMVIGYLAGYATIAIVLLPIYYKKNLISIYGYLEERFGKATYTTGATFFLLSRLIGSAFRLYLVAGVLQLFLFDELGIPFALNVVGTILLIWLYTFRGGIKTVLWTDIFQTTFMLLSVVLTIIFVSDKLNMSLLDIPTVLYQSPYTDLWVWNWTEKQYFFKQFFGGMFIAITMTGLDQDMMQKNLTCRTLADSQRNMFWFSLSLLPVNLLFLCLGALLWLYQDSLHLSLKGDELFPYLAKNHLGTAAGAVFLIGVIAAAYSSADSALAALTTSFYIDILKIDKRITHKAQQVKTRRLIHVGFSVLIALVIIGFHALGNKTVIEAVFKAATYTYGPLLGFYAFGIFTSYAIKDRFVPFVAIASPILCYILEINSPKWLNGYTFGVELLLLNGLLTFIGLFLLKDNHSGNVKT